MTSNQQHDRAAPPSWRSGRPALIASISLAVVVLAFGGGALTNAVFTSQSTVTGQTASSATVEIQSGVAATTSALTVDSLLPGDSASTTIDLDNTGTEGVYYTVRVPAAVGSDGSLADVLQVTVTVGATTQTHTLTHWQGGAMQIGQSLAAGDSNEVIVTVVLPTGTDDSRQNLDVAFSLQFDAIQQRNTAEPAAGWIAD